jgi:hypothetical protein
MKRIVIALVLLGTTLPRIAQADRITSMSPEERCVYVARLQAAAAHQYRQGKARSDLQIHWHGDETSHEIEFVTRVIDQGYEAMQREEQAGRRNTPVEIIGDRAYEACRNERSL